MLMFGLIVVGSVVRTTGSGLACPDWPLCEGRLVPRFEPHVLIEWFHRLLALLVSMMLLATTLWIVARPATRRRLGALAVLAVALLIAQVLLGALTVWKLLSPAVVSSHLAVALLLFSTLLTLTLSADAAAEPETMLPVRPPTLLPLALVATGLTYAQAVLGGVVSTSHAGLACPDWPTCLGTWLPPMRGLVGLHMAHRFGGYAVAVLVPFVAWRMRSATDPRAQATARLAGWMALVQATLGVCNVLLGTPIWLTALHLMTATTLLGLLVVTTFRLAALPAMSRVRDAAAAAVPATSLAVTSEAR